MKLSLFYVQGPRDVSSNLVLLLLCNIAYWEQYGLRCYPIALKTIAWLNGPSGPVVSRPGSFLVYSLMIWSRGACSLVARTVNNPHVVSALGDYILLS